MEEETGEVMEEESLELLPAPPPTPPPLPAPPPEKEGARDASDALAPGSLSGSAPCEGVVAASWALARQIPAPHFDTDGAARTTTCTEVSVCVRKGRNVCNECAAFLKRVEAQVTYYESKLRDALLPVGLEPSLALALLDNANPDAQLQAVLMVVQLLERAVSAKAKLETELHAHLLIPLLVRAAPFIPVHSFVFSRLFMEFHWIIENCGKGSSHWKPNQPCYGEHHKLVRAIPPPFARRRVCRL